MASLLETASPLMAAARQLQSLSYVAGVPCRPYEESEQPERWFLVGEVEHLLELADSPNAGFGLRLHLGLVVEPGRARKTIVRPLVSETGAPLTIDTLDPGALQLLDRCYGGFPVVRFTS